MKIIGNGTVVTLNDKNDIFFDSAVVIENSRIKEIDKTSNVKQKYPKAEFIDADSGIIMPGFLNAHMHLYSTFTRGMTSEPAKDFLEILEKLWFMMDKKLSTEEELYYSAIVPMIELIKCGTTSILDHHASYGMIDGSLDILEKAAKDAGIKAVLCYETSDRCGEEARDAAIAENVRFIKKKQQEKDDLIKANFGLHASITLSNETLEKCAAEEKALNTGFHVHVAEGIQDVKDCLEKYNKRVVERLNSFGILGDKTLAVHCVHVNNDELDLLRDTNTIVVCNPQSNMNNAVGVPPVMEMLDRNILVGLGNDGYGTSMFDSAKTSYIVHKLVKKDPRVGSEETRKLIFENNRKIFKKFFNYPVGVLKKGAAADIVIMDYYPPTPLTPDNFFYHFNFGMRDGQVNTVMINGKVVMKNHEFVLLDEKEIMAKSREVAKKYWEK